jgi:hypothetical protein
MLAPLSWEGEGGEIDHLDDLQGKGPPPRDHYNRLDNMILEFYVRE